MIMRSSWEESKEKDKVLLKSLMNLLKIFLLGLGSSAILSYEI
jgi:hypothetical protein